MSSLYRLIFCNRDIFWASEYHTNVWNKAGDQDPSRYPGPRSATGLTQTWPTETQCRLWVERGGGRPRVKDAGGWGLQVHRPNEILGAKRYLPGRAWWAAV